MTQGPGHCAEARVTERVPERQHDGLEEPRRSGCDGWEGYGGGEAFKRVMLRCKVVGRLLYLRTVPSYPGPTISSAFGVSAVEGSMPSGCRAGLWVRTKWVSGPAGSNTRATRQGDFHFDFWNTPIRKPDRFGNVSDRTTNAKMSADKPSSSSPLPREKLEGKWT
jgi:hypothetical protein